MIVSFAVVAYNEEKTLPSLLDDLCRQDYPHKKIEVLLIDSMSKDKTKEIMNQFAATDNGFMRVKVLENKNRTLPYGCNVALNNYTGDAIVRIDAHASISSDFISKNVAILNEGEAISGGQVISITADNTPMQNTLLIVENSIFCGGAAKFRRLTSREYVETMAFGLYRREVFEKVGKYNIFLSRTEDNDMNYRIREAGFQLCCDPAIQTVRFTRSTLKSLVRQKYLNGYWIGKTMGINPKCFSLFHFVPFAFVLGILFTSILAAFGIWQLSALMWGLYSLLVLGVSAMEIVKRPFSITNLLLPLLFFLLHVSYGIGTLVGIIEMPFWVKKIKKQS